MMNKFEMMGKDVRFEISSRAQQQFKKTCSAAVRRDGTVFQLPAA